MKIKSLRYDSGMWTPACGTRCKKQLRQFKNNFHLIVYCLLSVLLVLSFKSFPNPAKLTSRVLTLS